MTKAEFRIANHRRCKLIEKEFSGFTEEERSRPFTVPGWREECDRRHHENLTDAERLELKALTAVVDIYLEENFPLPVKLLEKLEALLKQM